MQHILAVVFVSAFACAPIHAQNPTPVKPVPRDLGAVAQPSPQIAAMKSALRNLTTPRRSSGALTAHTRPTARRWASSPRRAVSRWRRSSLQVVVAGRAW